MIILIETILILAITFLLFRNIQKIDNNYVASFRNPKLKFPNSQVEKIMGYIYIGKAKYKLYAVKNNKYTF